MAGFDGYLADFESARADALQAIDAYARCADAQQREDLVVEARAGIDEVERLIRVLESEADERKKDAAAKRKMDDKVRHCKTQLASLQSNLQKSILVGDARAKSVAGGAPAATNEKEHVTRYAEGMDRNGRHLDEAQRTLAETEAIAANTANNLLQQRNQLQHAQMDVDQAQQDTEEAGSHLRRLTIKAVTNKIVLALVILGLAVAIVLVSYYKWYPRDKKDYLGILPNTPTPTTAAPGTG